MRPVQRRNPRMKKWLSAILTVLMLVQALPLGALAGAGHVLTEEELAAAYALTGFGDSNVQRNAAYHKGMKPNATWNAMQVSDWLEEMLGTYLFSVEDILTREIQKKYDFREGESEGLVNVPLAIENVRLSILVKEDRPHWRVSIRSKKGTSAQQLAQRYFHGGGHENAAGGKIFPGEDFSRSRGIRSYIESILNEYLP